MCLCKKSGLFSFPAVQNIDSEYNGIHFKRDTAVGKINADFYITLSKNHFIKTKEV